MIELAKHIEILLLDNDCVIVPGFGGFMAHHVDAVYDEEECQFLPPSRTLGFNPQLHINDSLLAQSYVEAYDISYPDALKRIDADVAEMRQAISNDGYFELPDVGVIQMNEDGNMEFEPCLSGILTPELYALSSYEMKPLADEKAKVAPVVELKQETVVENQEVEDDEAYTEYEDEETADVISIKISTLKRIAAAAVVLAIVVFSAIPFSENIRTGLQKSSIDTGLLTKVMPKAQTTSPKELASIKVKPAPKAEKKQNAPVVKESVSEPKEKFVVVLASRVSKSNAENYVSMLQKQGIEDARVLSHGKSTKVICGSYESKEEANAGAREMRNKSHDFEGAWVLHVKED